MTWPYYYEVFNYEFKLRLLLDDYSGAQYRCKDLKVLLKINDGI